MLGFSFFQIGPVFEVFDNRNDVPQTCLIILKCVFSKSFPWVGCGIGSYVSFANCGNSSPLAIRVLTIEDARIVLLVGFAEIGGGQPAGATRRRQLAAFLVLLT